jgi:hypothetical protein
MLMLISVLSSSIVLLLSVCVGKRSTEQVGRIDVILKRAKRYRFASFYYDFHELLEYAECAMFCYLLSINQTYRSLFEQY